MSSLITVVDVRKRLNSIPKSITEGLNANRTYETGARAVITNRRASDIKRFIENSTSLNCDIPMHSVLDLYDALIEVGNLSDIKKMGNYIAENTVTKVRDAKATLALLRGRLTRLQNKINKGIKKAQVNVATATPNLPTPTVGHSEDKNEVANECYIKMIESCQKCIQCDRVIENYNRISKRFNLEVLFDKYTNTTDTVLELCKLVDTYDMPVNVKFNTVIETALYGLESRHKEYSRSEILESSIDYFLFKEGGFNSCKEILNSTLFFDKGEDMGDIEIITEEEPEELENKILYNSNNSEDYANDLLMAKYAESTAKEDKPVDFNKIFNNYKKTELSKEYNDTNKLKQFIAKLYSRNTTGIVEGSPSLLAWIRNFFIIGIAAVPAIGPFISLITFIADKFVALHYDRKQTNQMIDCLEKEKKAAKDKKKSAKDQETIDRLDKYIDSLDKAIDKIKVYRDELLTDKEKDEEYAKSHNHYDDDDFDLDDDFLESVYYINTISDCVDKMEKITESGKINPVSMYHLVQKVDADTLHSISEIAAIHPDMFFKEDVSTSVNDMIQDIKKYKVEFESSYARMDRLDALTTAKYALDSISAYSTDYIDLAEACNQFEAITEAYQGLDILMSVDFTNKSTLMEASLTNTLKMASMKLRQAMTKMSDRERQVSKTIDVSLNNFTKGVENALTNDNREAVIKGTVLPSASKVIKFAIVNAAICKFINPVLAIISSIAYFAINAKYKAKERQMCLDELEIELKMCQKYIEIAESKNDMKALKQLLTMQRELEREIQRIKYNMKVKFGQKYYDTKNVGEDNRYY